MRRLFLCVVGLRNRTRFALSMLGVVEFAQYLQDVNADPLRTRESGAVSIGRTPSQFLIDRERFFHHRQRLVWTVQDRETDTEIGQDVGEGGAIPAGGSVLVRGATPRNPPMWGAPAPGPPRAEVGGTFRVLAAMSRPCVTGEGSSGRSTA